ncbi:MAG: AGE family epimerase/isomerase [Candidatus Hydrogenedentes bacterium]|nr:AGE family epimerase/isomerase [Candidatus Hydrogenedentota bacterium]
MSPHVRLIISILAILAASANAQAADDPAVYERPSDNIALGKPYTLSPTPGYRYCTDDGDATQLTDGDYTEDYFWSQASTVGWQHAKPVVITLDLGADQSIRGVSLRTAAGTAGVFWPVGIYVFVAGDDQQFHWIGDLVTMSAAHTSPPSDSYATHRYWTDDLQTHGRYVAFAVLSEPYTFVDEVEVYAGDPAWVTSPLPGESVGDIPSFMRRLSVRVSVVRRISEDAAQLREAVVSSTMEDSLKNEHLAELSEIVAGINNIPDDLGAGFRAVLPLNDLHERVFAVQAQLWDAAGHDALTLWQTPTWDALLHLGPLPEATGAKVNVWMMNNEYRAAAFNLSNATTEPIHATIRFEGLPDGAMPPYVAVHEVAWTDTKTLNPVAAALPEAERGADGYELTIESGLTQQVWLTFHPTDLEPGAHEGAIVLEANGLPPVRVPVSLEIFPFRFPDKPRLHVGGWDYTDQPSMYMVTPENREPLIAHLRERFVDSPWATRAALPYGTFDPSGAMTEPPDTAHFDAWIDRWQGAAQYCVFASVNEHLHSIPMGTPEFNRAVKAWIGFWEVHIQQRGLQPEQFAMLLFDEPHAPEHDAIIIAWAEALREANTKIRIWEDPTYREITEANPEMLALCDVLCPNRPIFLRCSDASRQLYLDQRDAGRTLEFYSCSGPMRLLDPYLYCRLQAWSCWQYGAVASYFWAFGDDGQGSSWNEYGAERTAYTPVFLDGTSVTAGKHMEAIRESVEDYEYLAMLGEAIESATDRGIDAAIVNGARKLLDEAPERVCAAYEADPGFWWKAKCDRTVADMVRRKILEVLVALEFSSPRNSSGEGEEETHSSRAEGLPPFGAHVRVELDTYQILDSRELLRGTMVPSSQSALTQLADDHPDATVDLFVSALGPARPDWATENIPINEVGSGSAAITIPVHAFNGGYYRMWGQIMSSDDLLSKGDVLDKNGSAVTFCVPGFRSSPEETPVANPIEFVAQTVNSLWGFQSARIDGDPYGTPFLTVTRPVYASYRSIGYKRGDTYENYWFPERPMDLAPFLCDFELWPILDKLSELTGDGTYSAIVSSMAAAFTEHGFHPTSGLGYLGEEAGFDVWNRAVASTKTGTAPPAFKPKNTGTFPELPLDRLWSVAPDKMHRMGRSMFLGLVTNPENMDFNRYCAYDWDDSNQAHVMTQNTAHCAFDSVAGRMIHWWASCYARIGDEDCLLWAEKMTDKWAAVQHPESGLVPNFFGAVAPQEHVPMPPGEWAEPRATILMAVALTDAANELRQRDGGSLLADRLIDMARRIALGVARYDYDRERRVFREYLHLDGRPYEGTTRYTFPTQEQKDAAVKSDPQLAQVRVYDGAGFYMPGTYWELCAGSTIPLDLAQVATRVNDPELLDLIHGICEDMVDEARKQTGPVTEEGTWTFRASGEYIQALVLLYQTSGKTPYLEWAREIADREMRHLDQVVYPQWWRMPERAAFLNGLLELAAAT